MGMNLLSAVCRAKGHKKYLYHILHGISITIKDNIIASSCQHYSSTDKGTKDWQVFNYARKQKGHFGLTRRGGMC
jgi:hypothetical protein